MHLYVRKALKKPQAIPRFLWRKAKDTFFWKQYYDLLPEPKKIAPDFGSTAIQQAVVSHLKAAGISPVDYEVDVSAFRKYVAATDYQEYDYYNQGDAFFHEKALEHFVVARLLQFAPDDVYIDIAAGPSPTAAIYHEVYGCRSYRQHKSFPDGIHGDVIGGDACRLPVEDGPPASWLCIAHSSILRGKAIRG